MKGPWGWIIAAVLVASVSSSPNVWVIAGIAPTILVLWLLWYWMH
jgi:hypothetical protein